MDEASGDDTLRSCTSNVTDEQDEQKNENTTSLLAVDSSVSCDTLDACRPAQETPNEDYCMEATRLILDLSK